MIAFLAFGLGALGGCACGVWVTLRALRRQIEQHDREVRKTYETALADTNAQVAAALAARGRAPRIVVDTEIREDA